MKVLKLFKVPTLFSLALVLTGATLLTNASAYTGSSLYDGFSQLPLKPDPAANWYVINWGADEFGGQARVLDHCASNTCVQQGSEDGVDYVELAQYPGQLPYLYYNAELTEYETGFAYGTPTEWTPEIGHPVVFEVRAKWSENYLTDGTGGATGSNGFWVWNSPADFIHNQFNPTDAIGFQWISSNSSALPGLKVAAFDENIPVFTKEIKHVDMHEWNTYTIEWYLNPAGHQFVHASVNGQTILRRQLQSPMANLSVEVWSDNQTPQLDGSITLESPNEEQSMYIDYINLSKN